jgi:hypothetical protein
MTDNGGYREIGVAIYSEKIAGLVSVSLESEMD